MATLNIDYVKAKQTGEKIQTIAENMDALLNKVSTEMEKIGGESWQSDNASSFKINFYVLKSNFGKVYDAVNSMGQALNASAQMYESGETNN